MRKVAKFLIFYLSTFFLFTGFYLILFRSPIFIKQKVLFYRGLLLLLLNLFLWLLISILFYKKKLVKFSLESIIASLIVSFSLNLSFFVVFPVTFERSVTMYLLKKLYGNENQCISKKQLEDSLIEEYIIKNNALDKRLVEQSIINFIDKKNQCLSLTQKAKNFIQFSKKINWFYNLNTR
ncbi:MAG: hypothetical protein QHH09_04675 [Microgenomates group bacterium]|nr:hypothetical protein [Microgenomates group bacterium]